MHGRHGRHRDHRHLGQQRLVRARLRHVFERHGAVSEPVAKAMAEGALRNSRAQVALSVTGVAGPGGGTETKPVGMVSFAWSNRLHTAVETHVFKGDREQVRTQAAAHALRGLLELLERRER